MADITLTFGQDIGFGPERGTDVAVPVGTPVVSPFSGSFSSESLGQTNWGNRAFVDLGNGLTYAVGHLTQFAKNPGDYVNAGDVIGYSGGAVGDPNSGMTTGPHVEFQFLQGGQFQNPQDVLAQLGLTFDQLFQPGTALPGQPILETQPQVSGGAFSGASLDPITGLETQPQVSGGAFSGASLDPITGFIQTLPPVIGAENIGRTIQGQPLELLPGVQLPTPNINITNTIPGLSQVGDFVTALQKDLLRVGFVLAGVFLIGLGIFVMVQSSSTVRSEEAQAVGAATKAAVAE